MNWNAKEQNEISLNKIWSEHVRRQARSAEKVLRQVHALSHAARCLAG